jgi:PAS domain-containing protein
VGTTWYTWLEQGRDVRASASVLESISGALELTPAEHAHLMLLGRGEQVAPARSPKEIVNPTIRRMVESMSGGPACLTGRRFDFLAWNRAHAAVFGDPAEMPAGRRNLLWCLFTDPARRTLHPDWEEGARRVVARFRSEAGRHVGDSDFDDLISALQERSPEFREWWDLHEVATSGVGRKILQHPAAGKLVFEHAVFRPQESLEQRLVVYSAVPQANTPEKLANLLADQP